MRQDAAVLLSKSIHPSNHINVVVTSLSASSLPRRTSLNRYLSITYGWLLFFMTLRLDITAFSTSVSVPSTRTEHAGSHIMIITIIFVSYPKFRREKFRAKSVPRNQTHFSDQHFQPALEHPGWVNASCETTELIAMNGSKQKEVKDYYERIHRAS